MYINLPQISAKKDLLLWWKDNESDFPTISAMATGRQVLGCTAASAGVERLFSKAGRNHSALQRALKECTMRDMLFAYNVSRKF